MRKRRYCELELGAIVTRHDGLKTILCAREVTDLRPQKTLLTWLNLDNGVMWRWHYADYDFLDGEVTVD